MRKFIESLSPRGLVTFGIVSGIFVSPLVFLCAPSLFAPRVSADEISEKKCVPKCAKWCPDARDKPYCCEWEKECSPKPNPPDPPSPRIEDSADTCGHGNSCSVRPQDCGG